MSILVIAEHLRGQVRDVTRELITAGRQLGGPLTVGVISRDPSRFREAVNLAGVDEIVNLAVGGEEFESDVYQQAVQAIITQRKPEVVLLGFTVNSMGYAPAVAVRLGLGFASDVFALARDGDRIVATRAFYAAKVHAELEFPASAGTLLLLRPGIWAPAEGTGLAAVSDLPPPEVRPRARHIRFMEPPTGDVEITTADFLLSVGRGIGEKEKIPVFEALAAKMGATLSSSRPLVDAGWMPSARQVGQSGKTVKPKVYVALGISGAVQHLAGMRNSGTIIAVNTDPEAAIFGTAHYGAVADLFDVAAELDRLF